MSRTVILGFVLTLASAFFFAVSGPIAKTMYAVGWTPGAVVLIRLVGAALLLLVPSLIAARGRWAEVRARLAHRPHLRTRLDGRGAGLLLRRRRAPHRRRRPALLEMTAPMLIVFWIWARTRTRPATVTFIGVVISMIGLLLVLNLRGASISILGVVMALAAAVCLASYFLVSAKDTITVPPVALTGLGMGVGALVMGVVVLIGVMPWGATVHDVDFGGVQASWVPPMALIVLFTAGAYITGILGLRYIGATVGSFVNLIEVPFSVAVAWLLLAEMPAPIQLFGGVFILGGVVFIKWGESRLARRVRDREVVARSEAFAEV